MENVLKEAANKLVAQGRGILAADESTGTIEKRLSSISVASTEENRRKWRQLLFTASGIEQYISGVILYDETIRQRTDQGIPFPQFLSEHGIIPGIKVDKGTELLPDSPEEKITKGLDGLEERLSEYKKLGAKFTKWRAVITIGEGLPTKVCIQKNAEALAQYAAISQAQGFVPIIEPEVLMDGSHIIGRCAEVTEEVLTTAYQELARRQVFLEGTLLKPNMVLPGEDSKESINVQDVAKKTIEVLSRTVPPNVPGIVFLSGGQSDRLATEHLNEMNRLGPHPWKLSFSYGRALQGAALKIWGGKDENVKTAQEEFLRRAKLVSLAAQGKYSPSLEG